MCVQELTFSTLRNACHMPSVSVAPEPLSVWIAWKEMAGRTSFSHQVIMKNEKQVCCSPKPAEEELTHIHCYVETCSDIYSGRPAQWFGLSPKGVCYGLPSPLWSHQEHCSRGLVVYMKCSSTFQRGKVFSWQIILKRKMMQCFFQLVLSWSLTYIVRGWWQIKLEMLLLLDFSKSLVSKFQFARRWAANLTKPRLKLKWRMRSPQFHLSFK